MGMDVYGLKAKYWVSPTHPLPRTQTCEDCTRAVPCDSTNQCRLAYLQEMEEYWEANPGVYFRANVWSWRPILDLIYQANDQSNLGISEETLNKMGYNEGAGLQTQQQCDNLADAMESLLEQETSDTLSWDSGVPGFEDAYKVNKDHVLKFTKFLRECGGFEVL